MAMIKPIFTFFQMQIKGSCRYAVKILQAAFGIRPETFYPVDMNIADGENVVRVIDTQMFRIPDINQSIVAAPAVRMNHRIETDFAANNVLQSFPLRLLRQPDF